MRKNNSREAALVLLLFLSMVLSACGGRSVTQTPSPTIVPAEQSIAPVKSPTMTEAPAQAMTNTAEPGTSGEIDCMGAKSGDTLSILYPWSGADEEMLMDILKPLVDSCGIVLEAESFPDPAQLDAQVDAGNPPDIAFSKISELAQYKTQLKSLTDLGVNEKNYAGYWKDSGTVDGSWLGLPVKVDLETIMWYSPVKFKDFGYQVPTTLSEFQSLIGKMAADGNSPWSMGLESGDSTGRIGANVIEDILIAEDGAEYVGNIIDGSLPYNSSGVARAYRVYGSWAKGESYTPGGAKGTLSTNVNDAIYKVFSDPPEAMMVRQSGHTGEIIASHFPNLKFGKDYDFFQEPLAHGQVHGSTDWMMAFNDSAAVKVLVSYLSSDQGGQRWAQVGFGNTPNGAGTNAYKDAGLTKLAQILASAHAFVPDIQEAVPEEFASAERKAVVDYINGADLDKLLDNVAAVQTKTLGK